MSITSITLWFCLFLACIKSRVCATTLSATQIGVLPAGDDWEPAIASDGTNVYAVWPHFSPFPTMSCSSSIAISIVFLQKGTWNGNSITWSSTITQPACPTTGQQIDVNVRIGPQQPNGNHRVYISYMEGFKYSIGNSANAKINVIYSDDLGVTWSSPVDASLGVYGDKPMMIVDSTGAVVVSFDENLKQGASSNYINYSPNPNPNFSFSVKQSNFLPSSLTGYVGTGLTFGAAQDTKGLKYFSISFSGNTYITESWVISSSDNFAHYTLKKLDTTNTPPVGPAADFWGGQVSVGTIPIVGQTNDRVIVAYITNSAANNPMCLYTQYSDDNGVTWSTRQSLGVCDGLTYNFWPTVIGNGTTGVWIAWSDNRGIGSSNNCGQCKSCTCGTWNVYKTFSSNGNGGWTTADRMYGFSSSLSYTNTSGFCFPYGDYQTFMSDGSNIVGIWGESAEYCSAGTIWTVNF